MQTIKVKNPQTGDIEEIEVDETMKTDLGSGSTPETETKRMVKEKGYQVLSEVVNPQNGESHLIDEAELGGAYKKGYKLRTEYDAENIPDQSDINPIEAAGYGFAKFATMGAAPAVGGAMEWIKGGKYEKGRQDYENRQEQAFQEHPAWYGSGAMGSMVPGFFAKGVGLIGAAIPGLATKGSGLAAQAAIGAAPPLVEQATKEPTVEGWKQAGKEAAIGGGLGLGLGAAFGAMAPKIAKGAQGASERRAVKAIGGDVLAPTRRTQRMPGGVQAMGRDLMDLGIVGAGDDIQKMGQKAFNIKQSAGGVIGKSADNFDKYIGRASVNNSELIKEVGGVVDELMSNPSTREMANTVKNKFYNHLTDWASEKSKAGVGNSTLKELWAMRSKLDDLAYTTTGIDKPLNEQLQKIRRILEERLIKTAQQNGVPEEQISNYIKNKRIYQVANEASVTAADKINRMQTNRMFSLSDYIAGSGAGATIGAKVGAAGGLAGAGGVLGAAVGAIVNKVSRERGPQASAIFLRKLSELQKTEPQKFGSIISDFIKTGQIVID